jgi:hypothetical protein
VLLLGMLLQAATLEKLALDDMTQQSTAIVRARVTGSYAAANGALIYTHYRVQVGERWKGAEAASLDVVVPGGRANGLRQTISGAPKLMEGREYVLFLWTGPSGLTHIMGLSQGVFDVKTEANGEVVASRAASGELMLDSAGRPMRDEALTLRLNDLHQRVSRASAEGGRK